jgi:hypothetical protein
MALRSNDYVGVAIFLFLWISYHGGMKIANNLALLLSLALSE